MKALTSWPRPQGVAKKSQIGEQALLENRTEEAEIRKAEKKKKKDLMFD